MLKKNQIKQAEAEPSSGEACASKPALPSKKLILSSIKKTLKSLYINKMWLTYCGHLPFGNKLWSSSLKFEFVFHFLKIVVQQM